MHWKVTCLNRGGGERDVDDGAGARGQQERAAGEVLQALTPGESDHRQVRVIGQGINQLIPFHRERWCDAESDSNNRQ